MLALAGLAAIAIAFSEFRLIRTVDRSDPASSLEYIKAWQPWGGLASLQASRVLSLRWRADPDQAERVLAWQLQRYPIDPQGWLVRSTVAFRTNASTEQRAAHLSAAVATQPHNHAIRWQTAMTSLRAGDTDLAEQHLKLAATGDHRYTSRAMFVAQRWIGDSEELLNRVVPDSEAHLIEAMRHARQTEAPDLAEAVWQRLDHPRQPGERVVTDYLDLALRTGHHERVLSAWSKLDPHFRRGNVPAGSFHLPLDAMPSFGWRLAMPSGVSIARDGELPGQVEDSFVLSSNDASLGDAEYFEPGSLRLDFDGNENLRFRHLTVRFPVPEPGRYRLHGWWQGEHLTTRSLPRLEVGLRHGGLRERIEVPSGHFPWQPFDVDFEVEDTGEIMTLRLLRDPTDAFDRYIAGSLWLAGLHIKASDRPDNQVATDQTQPKPLGLGTP